MESTAGFYIVRRSLSVRVVIFEILKEIMKEPSWLT